MRGGPHARTRLYTQSDRSTGLKSARRTRKYSAKVPYLSGIDLRAGPTIIFWVV